MTPDADATPAPTDTPAPPPGYRANVGVVLFRRDGRVWLGRRAGAQGPQNWQFPQGGVDRGEALDVAARRELEEETGVTSARLLQRTGDWIAYDFPPAMGGSKAARGFRGQAQVWFAFLFEGEDAEVDLQRHHEVEFEAWRWATLDEALLTVAPFKRDAYGRVLAEFAPVAARLAGAGPA